MLFLISKLHYELILKITPSVHKNSCFLYNKFWAKFVFETKISSLDKNLRSVLLYLASSLVVYAIENEFSVLEPLGALVTRKIGLYVHCLRVLGLYVHFCSSAASQRPTVQCNASHQTPVEFAVGCTLYASSRTRDPMYCSQARYHTVQPPRCLTRV